MANGNEFEDISNVLKEHDKRISRIEAMLATKQKPIKQKSFNELLSGAEQKKPKSEVEMIRVAGYYLENYKGFASFNLKDLENLLRTSKRKVPNNTSLAVRGNIQSGYFEEIKEKKGGRKAWVLTSSGENSVVQAFKIN